MIRPPKRVWPLIELELRDKNGRVGLHERKRMVPNFKVSVQPMTSEARSNIRRGPSEMTIFGIKVDRNERIGANTPKHPVVDPRRPRSKRPRSRSQEKI